MTISFKITANHLGYSEFSICNVDNLTTDATQDCLNKIILKDSNGKSKFYIPPNFNGAINTSLVLPSDLKCNHCVFQVNYLVLLLKLKFNIFKKIKVALDYW